MEDRIRPALIGLTLLLIPLTGCASPNSVSEEPPPLLEKARKAYLTGIGDQSGMDAGKLKEARRRAEKYLDRFPDGRGAGEAWYLIGQVELQFQNPENVLKAVQNGLEQVEETELEVALLMLKGKASSLRNDAEQALQAYQAASDLVDDRSTNAERINRAELEYRRANMLVRVGKFGEAENVFRSLIEKFPDTEYAGKSRDKLRFMSDYYSVQLGLFRKRKNAISLKQKLRRNGRNAYILSNETGNGSLYSVRLGKFNRYEQARILAERLQNQGYETVVKP